MFLACGYIQRIYASVYSWNTALAVDFDAYAEAVAIFVSTSFTQMSKSIFIPLQYAQHTTS